MFQSSQQPYQLAKTGIIIFILQIRRLKLQKFVWQLVQSHVELKHRMFDSQFSVPYAVLFLPAFLIHIDYLYDNVLFGVFIMKTH